MHSSGVVAGLQLSHWNKGLPLIGLVDLVHLDSLKHGLEFSLNTYYVVLHLAHKMQQPILRRQILNF